MKFRSALVVGGLVLASCGGGQSGDDGGATPDILPKVPPPTPMEYACSFVETSLSFDEATTFERTAQELISGLGSDTPFFWVPYNALEGTTFSPGPGESTLSLRVSRRDESVGDYSAEILQWAPGTETTEAEVEQCRANVSVPAWLDVSTPEGTLDEHLAVTLQFGSATHASLSGTQPVAEINGSFRILETGRNFADELFEPRSLHYSARLWQGGSTGRISPNFKQLEPTDPTAVHPPPDHLDVPPADEQLQQLPAGWSSVAVWPYREICRMGGVPLDSEQAVIGISVANVLEQLANENSWLGERATAAITSPLFFDPVSSEGPICTEWNRQHLNFTVEANLRSPATESSALGRDVSAYFAISASTNAAGTQTEHISFTRTGAAFYEPMTRAELETALGVSLNTTAEYELFWWTWQGTLERQTDGSYSHSAELVVSSLNAAETAQFREYELLVEQAAKASPPSLPDTDAMGNINATEVTLGPPVAVFRREDDRMILPGDVVFREEY